MSSAPQATKTAVCNCAKVRFTVTGVDQGAVLCHCSNCKKASGSAFAHNHVLADATITFASGADDVTAYPDGNTDSGNVWLRHFCRGCGCPMYLQEPGKESLIIVNSGVLEGEIMRPGEELYAKDRLAWMPALSAES